MDISPHTHTSEQIVIALTPLVKWTAQKIARRAHLFPLDQDDLVSAGYIGLMEAISRFDPGQKVKFKTFAEWRIRGQMLDEIRARDRKYIDLKNRCYVSTVDAPDPMTPLLYFENNVELAERVNLLPDQMFTVICLRYGSGLALHEIGELMGVGEARVCQIEKASLLALRESYHKHLI